MKFMLASALFFSTAAYLAADPVEVSIASLSPIDIRVLDLMGTFSCQQSGITSAACQTNFGQGSYQGGGIVTANASFGSASASATGSGSGLTPGPMYYNTSFNDNLVVTGGTGAGTLIVQYQLTASSIAYVNPTQPPLSLASPEFSFVQGSTRESFYTNLNTSADTVNQSFEVSSPFLFGTPFAFGAETQNFVGDYVSSYPFSDIVGAQTESSLQLTGFTVLDASGHVIAGAQLTPQNVAGLDFFTPEPFSGSLALLGLALLAWPAARCRQGR